MAHGRAWRSAVVLSAFLLGTYAVSEIVTMQGWDDGRSFGMLLAFLFLAAMIGVCVLRSRALIGAVIAATAGTFSGSVMRFAVPQIGTVPDRLIFFCAFVLAIACWSALGILGACHLSGSSDYRVQGWRQAFAMVFVGQFGLSVALWCASPFPLIAAVPSIFFFAWQWVLRRRNGGGSPLSEFD